ncbi:MAG: type II toxin-antitoxin system RelE/ParE family toxin [Candidatus Omnitrophica bacterium]|nr:type II toxin-antitoxin system RelE/ParE family toxin [Candidatus Omnitrophota bacterium]MDE2215198.1 type II toxin-antitoxin system RelE/ParE family toxin [Candidatus Omnitrophota bacterium]
MLDDVFKDRAISLGFKLYKIRGAKDGQGKSGGFRNIFFWQKDERIVFCLVYPKNVRDNIDEDIYKSLKILSDTYENYSEDEIKKQVGLRNFTEIKYEKK